MSIRSPNFSLVFLEAISRRGGKRGKERERRGIETSGNVLYFVRWKEGWGWVIYWHVYVIVAICRGRKRENDGERVVRAGEKYRGCERVSRPRVNAQCITGLRGGRISSSNSTWIPEILTTETLRNHRSVLPFLHPFRFSPLLLPLSFNTTKAVRGMKMDPRLKDEYHDRILLSSNFIINYNTNIKYQRKFFSFCAHTRYTCMRLNAAFPFEN